MCDTFVALGKATSSGNTLFGKNSDREPNEPQYTFFYPRTLKESGDLYTTSQKVEQVEQTYALLLSKPSWTWGGEMGVNENGVVIGNEAVFTRERVRREGLLGMDILRIALERSQKAESAMEIIIDLITKYGQGGNGGYTKSLFYHNSYIVADREKAWILETADKYWVASEVEDFASISNCLTLSDSLDRQHPGIVENALERGWYKGKGDFRFGEVYENKFYRWISGGEVRRNRVSKLLNGEKLSLQKCFDILRDHEQKKLLGSMKNVCMHAGSGVVSFQTTGSMVVSLGEDIEVWLTNTSAPCLSLYKPVWFDDRSSTLPFNKESEALNYWGNWEIYHRLATTRYKNAKQLWENYCLPFEDELVRARNFENRKEITKQAFETGWKIAKKMATLLREGEQEVRYFDKIYWKKKDRELQQLKERNFKKILPT